MGAWKPSRAVRTQSLESFFVWIKQKRRQTLPNCQKESRIEFEILRTDLFAGKNQLVAIDEPGNVRTLYPTAATDRFFTGPGAALSTSVESRIEFEILRTDLFCGTNRLLQSGELL